MEYVTIFCVTSSARDSDVTVRCGADSKWFFLLSYALMPDSYAKLTIKHICFSFCHWCSSFQTKLEIKVSIKLSFWRWIHHAFMFPRRTLQFVHACIHYISGCANTKVIRTVCQLLEHTTNCMRDMRRTEVWQRNKHQDMFVHRQLEECPYGISPLYRSMAEALMTSDDRSCDIVPMMASLY